MSEFASFDNQDSELLAVFIEEAREQIDVLDQGLVRLEREPSNVELIQAIFRAAHTLKGSSGAMGYRRMAQLTHAMEDVLDRVRDNQLRITTTVADALLEGLDHLRHMEQAIENGQDIEADGTAIDEAITALHHIASGTDAQPTEAKTGPAALPVLPDAYVALLIQISDDCQMPAIRAFMVKRALESAGTLIESTPSQEEIDQGKLERRLLLVFESSQDEESLRKCILDVGEIDWVRAARGMAATGMHLMAPEREDSRAEAEEPLHAEETTTYPAQNGAAAAVVHTQQTVRVSVDMLDRIMNLVGELVLDRTRVTQLKDELDIRLPDEELVRDLDAVSHHLGAIVGELHEQVLQARMLPVSQLFNRFPRLVRDLSRKLGKEVEFIVEGETEQLDRSVIENLVDPLTHLLRNALDHGLETPDVREAQGKPRTGTITLSAERQEEHVLIKVSDDGPGINVERLKEKAVTTGLVTPERARAMSQQEAYMLLFASGVSTAEQVSDVSGRGVGMDVVKRNIDALGGAVNVESTPAIGTTFTLKIPLTLAIVRALLVRIGEVVMALPLTVVEETITIARRDVHSVRGRAIYKWRDVVVPVIRLNEVMPGCGEAMIQDELHLVVVRYAGTLVCFAVDNIMGHQEIVVKPMGNYMGEITGIAGATILGNGRVALIIDVGKLFEVGLLQQAAAEGIGDAVVNPVRHKLQTETAIAAAAV